MSLNKKQNEAIDLLIIGNLSKSQIAKSIDIGERTIYNWISDNEEFKAEWQKRADAFNNARTVDAKNKLSVHLDMAINNIIEMANDKGCAKQYEANKYLIDRIMGNTTTKIEQSNTDSTGKNTNVSIEDMLKEIEADNVVALPASKAK